MLRMRSVIAELRAGYLLLPRPPLVSRPREGLAHLLGPLVPLRARDALPAMEGLHVTLYSMAVP